MASGARPSASLPPTRSTCPTMPTTAPTFDIGRGLCDTRGGVAAPEFSVAPRVGVLVFGCVPYRGYSPGTFAIKTSVEACKRQGLDLHVFGRDRHSPPGLVKLDRCSPTMLRQDESHSQPGCF